MREGKFMKGLTPEEIFGPHFYEKGEKAPSGNAIHSSKFKAGRFDTKMSLKNRPGLSHFCENSTNPKLKPINTMF